jgi:hypothetical protein
VDDPGARGQSEVPGKIPGFWRALYDGGADVVLNGHVHSYERFAKLSRTARWMRREASVNSSREREGRGCTTSWPDRYKWEFIDLNGVVLDQGSDTCH